MATCSFCGQPAEGNFSIHRGPGPQGPEVPLCDACGGEAGPSCEEIWAVLALPEPEARARLAARTLTLADPPLSPVAASVLAAKLAICTGSQRTCLCGVAFSIGCVLSEDHRRLCLTTVDRHVQEASTTANETVRHLLSRMRRYVETAPIGAIVVGEGEDHG